MNNFEKLVYNIVKSNPQLKMHIRDVYQQVFDLLPIKRNQSRYGITVHEDCFFGFHDKCPWSFDNLRLLAQRFNLPLRMPGPNDEIEVGFIDRKGNGSFTTLGKTRAWNWHQGSMLQWLGNSLNIAFNDFNGSNHIAQIVSTDGTVLQKISAPLAAISPDGKTAISYNFARLRGTPHGYAYANGEDPEFDRSIPTRHGLSVIDLHSGQIDHLFSGADIAELDPESSMAQAFHYFSHCQFSPAGDRFKFFHRWTDRNQLQWTRMITCGLHGNDLYIFPTGGMVSHVAWRDPHHLLAYARLKNQRDGYYLFHDRTPEIIPVGHEVFTSDGHPSYSKDRRWILTDTYADRYRQRHLILYDTQHDKKFTLLKLYSPKTFAGVSIADHLQCDFHPRWNRDATQICFDSAHTGRRSLCTIETGNLDTHDPLTL